MIGFSRSRYMVIEDTERVSVTVQLQSGNIRRSISLRIYTQRESATGNALCCMLEISLRNSKPDESVPSQNTNCQTNAGFPRVGTLVLKQ